MMETMAAKLQTLWNGRGMEKRGGRESLTLRLQKKRRGREHTTIAAGRGGRLRCGVAVRFGGPETIGPYICSTSPLRLTVHARSKIDLESTGQPCFHTSIFEGFEN